MITPGNICDNCGLQYELAASNSVIYYYECQPWFSFAASICPKCNSSARLFFPEQHIDYMAFFIMDDFPFITEEFAPDALVKSYENVFGLKLLDEAALTPRMEREIDATSIFLQITPDEWIYELFKDPAPKLGLPERWR